MALLRKLNRVLSLLLVLLFLALLYNKVIRVRLPPERSELRNDRVLSPRQTGEGEIGTDVPVVICASEERVGAAMATVSSVYSNTLANVFFYIVTLRDSIELVRQYIENTKLKDIRYKIIEFNPVVLKGKVKLDSSRPELLHPLNFVRFYLPLLVIGSHRRVVYLDDDVIVQVPSCQCVEPPGDIQELYSIKLQAGHAAAFASDCDLPASHEMVRTVGMQTTFMGFLDYRKQGVRDLGIDPRDCSFNPGVFVADIEEWLKQRITKQLEEWMRENFKENLYSSAMAGGVATPPMLIVFHNKYTKIEPKWHVRHLGWSPDAHYARTFLQGAKLLHWNGHFKPWSYPCVHLDLWEKWFIPDPSGRFLLVRPKM